MGGCDYKLLNTLDLFKKRLEFMKKMSSEYFDNGDEAIRDYCIGIIKNANEILSIQQWDRSKEKKDVADSHIRSEMIDAAVDIINFAMNIVLHHSDDEEDAALSFEDAFEVKDTVVNHNLKQKRLFDSERFSLAKNVFVVDIDGVLSDYCKGMIDFANAEDGRPRFSNWGEFSRWKENNIEDYHKLKIAYRTSGYKRIMPMVKDANDLLRFCSKNGIVVIISNRPVKDYPIIYNYTIDWFKRTGMLDLVDMIYFTDHGEKKYLFSKFKGKKMHFIEDSIENFPKPSECDSKNYYIVNDGNRHTLEDFIASNILICYNLKEVKRSLENNIENSEHMPRRSESKA